MFAFCQSQTLSNPAAQCFLTEPRARCVDELRRAKPKGWGYFLHKFRAKHLADAVVDDQLMEHCAFKVADRINIVSDYVWCRHDKHPW